ncbi:MAG: DUF222 domain-containing protein [Acidimicrobiales bacterium]|nr:DUF222 domain-containing protein [Acidimicrobiales bacterium]
MAEGLAVLAAAEVRPFDADGANELIRRVEAIGSQVDQLQARVLAEVEASHTFAEDGHRSAKAMVEHIAHLSPPEAARRARRVRTLLALPHVAAAYAAGRIGTSQVDRIAQVHANPRVRDRLVALDEDLAVVARKLPYREFHLLLANWEALNDEDGARERNQRAHEARDHRISQEFDRTARIDGRCGALDGAYLRAIQQRFEEAEFARDRAEARAIHGDQATRDQLPRTDAQRRFDATKAIYEAAAQHHAAQPGGSPVTLDVVIDHVTFERELRKLAGEQVPSRNVDLDLVDRSSSDHPGDASGTGFRCDTLDGWQLEPTEATVASLVSHVRRVVVGAAGRIIDLGRSQRLFTGAAAAAAHLRSRTCVWPGCTVAARWCQVDHVLSWRGGGRTDQENAGLLCGRHNRIKESGFTVHCDPDGTWHTHRPDGTEIDAARDVA